MAYYIIRRIDQGGGWVTPTGSTYSYTKDRREALHYKDKAVAQANCCDNEVVEEIRLESYVSTK